MADNTVAITAGSGTSIRTVTNAAADGGAHQQVMSLADLNGNLNPALPDGTLTVDIGATSLLFDTFDTTFAQWTTGGTVAPVLGSGGVTFSAATTASATSYMSSVNTIPMNANSYLELGWVVQIDTNSALTNSTRWWGYGNNAGSPTAAAPVQNGVVFLLDYVAGTFYAAVFSNGTRTQATAITKPTDGAIHRYQIFFRTTKAYFVQDGVVVATLSNPNPLLTNNLFLIAGSANNSTGPSSAPTMVSSVASAADSGSNNNTISDATTPSVRATVKKASTAALSTDTALVTDQRMFGTQIVSANLTAVSQVADGATILDGFSSARIHVSGTFVGTVVFETSPDATNWAVTNAINTSTGVTTNTPSPGSFTTGVAGRYFRVRCSAYTSGTIVVTIVYSAQAPFFPVTTPTATLQAGTNVAGAFGVLSSTGGTGVFYVSTGTNAAQVAKASAGNLMTLMISNNAASTQFVKLFNATAVTLGTTAAVVDIPVAAAATVSVNLGANGQRFGTGICFAITGAAGATNNTANTASCYVALTYV